MLTIIAFLFVLSVLVVIHELGHFSVAKFFGIEVERFSVGLPPKIAGKKIGETEYVISAIPFGGYVKMAGQDDFSTDEEYKEIGPRDFRGKSAWVRVAVLAAGSVMNLLAAAVIFSLLFMAVGVPVNTMKIGFVEPGSAAEGMGVLVGDTVTAVDGKPAKTLEDTFLAFFTQDRTTVTVAGADGKLRELTINRRLKNGEVVGIAPWMDAVVGGTVTGTPAEKAGLRKGDRIAAIDGVTVNGWYDMNRIVRASAGRQLAFTIERDGTPFTVTITPVRAVEQRDDGGEEWIGRIGVMAQSVKREVGFAGAVCQGAGQTWYYAVNTLDFFVKLVTGQMSPKLLGGPVMIAELAGESARTGLVSLFSFMAFISVNLGVLNLLPFPVLDGGHIFIICIEAVTRRKLSIRARTMIQQAGTLLLLFLMFYVTFNDIMRIDALTRFFGK